MNESCHTYQHEWHVWSQMSHVVDTQMSHVSSMNESCPTHQRAWQVLSRMSHDSNIRMSPVSNRKESCHSWHVTHINASCHTSAWVTCLLFVCVTWPIDMHDVPWVPWLLYIWDMTHSYVWHDALLRVTWLIDVCDLYVEIWVICRVCMCVYVCVCVCMCDTARWDEWHAPFVGATWLV